VTAPLLSMFVVPAIYRLMRRRGRPGDREAADPGKASFPIGSQSAV
jgi:hypothetical protein